MSAGHAPAFLKPMGCPGVARCCHSSQLSAAGLTYTPSGCWGAGACRAEPCPVEEGILWGCSPGWSAPGCGCLRHLPLTCLDGLQLPGNSVLQIMSEHAPCRVLFQSRTSSLLCSETKRGTSVPRRQSEGPSASPASKWCRPGGEALASVPQKPTFSPGLCLLPVNGSALCSWLCAYCVRSKSLPGGPQQMTVGARMLVCWGGYATGPRTGLAAPASHSLLGVPLRFFQLLVGPGAPMIARGSHQQRPCFQK